MTNLFHISRIMGEDDAMRAHLTILTKGGEQNIIFKMSLANFARALSGERVRITDLRIHNRADSADLNNRDEN